MPLNPQEQSIIDQARALNLPTFDQLTPEEAREQYLRGRMPVPPEPVANVDDRVLEIDGARIPIRIYTPDGVAPYAALVYFHGGGWVIGNIETHDQICRKLANRGGCMVISVEYRVAPEHKFPTAAEDAYGATAWVAAHAADLGIDASRIAVGGDSAGGNLAAAVTLMARDRGGPPLMFQALIYPVTHFNFDTPSYTENAEGYFLTQGSMRWFWGHYLASEADGEQPYASPLAAKDLGGLPPALIIAAEFDPLRDEDAAYAQRLREAGVDATYHCYDGTIHGFVQMEALLDAGKAAIEEVGAALKAAFATEPVAR
jgi:acetyl esterase